MEYARNRGVEVYFFTWNVFTWGGQGQNNMELRAIWLTKRQRGIFVPVCAEAGENLSVAGRLGHYSREGMPGRMDASQGSVALGNLWTRNP